MRIDYDTKYTEFDEKTIELEKNWKAAVQDFRNRITTKIGQWVKINGESHNTKEQFN